jgi:hypothetical protein
MARTPKAVSDSEINVRLEIVKTLILVPDFVELEVPVQLSIIDTLVNYVLTGKK